MVSDNSATRPRVKIEKEFNVSEKQVFDAWLDPKMIAQWMFGPNLRDEEVISLEVDPQEGGTFSFVVLRDGGRLDHRGTYRTVDRPDKLVFTWGVNEEAGDESVVSIDIESTNNGCRLTLVHVMDPKWKEYTERTREGWTTMLNKLKEIIN